MDSRAEQRWHNLRRVPTTYDTLGAVAEQSRTTSDGEFEGRNQMGVMEDLLFWGEATMKA